MDTQKLDKLNLNLQGHVIIKDPDSGEILVNKRNAIHLENISYAIASVMSNTSDVNSHSGFVYDMAFGNGGVVVDSTGDVIYNKTKTVNIADTMYNETFAKVVNFTPLVDANNNTTVVHEGGTTYSDIIITCTLNYNEPSGQDALDNTITQASNFVFDEISLRSQQGRLLTHLVFHPVQKSANRKIQVIYTVRISAG